MLSSKMIFGEFLGFVVDKERGWTDKILKINYRKIYFYLQS